MYLSQILILSAFDNILNLVEKEEKEMEEAITKVDANPAYKVLTKEEYEILIG